MKNTDIEKKLKNASNSFVPDVFGKILQRRNEAIYEEYPFAEPTKTKQRRFKKKYITAFAAILIIAIGIGLFLGIMNQDNEVVYMEINPAMEITTNRFDRVKKVRYLNEDAEEMFSQSNIKWQKLDKAVEMFVDLSYQNGYMTEDNTMYIMAEARDSKKAEQTAQRLRQQAAKRTEQKNIGTNIIAERVTEEQREQAKNASISVAKLALITQIIRYDNSYTREELIAKSMVELQNIRKSQQDEEKEATTPGNTNSGNGNADSDNITNPANPGNNNTGNGNTNPGNDNANPGNGNSGNNR